MPLNLAPPLPHTRGLDALGRMAARQVRDVLDAYVARDGEAALRVRDRDAELDTLYPGVFRERFRLRLRMVHAIALKQLKRETEARQVALPVCMSQNEAEISNVLRKEGLCR